MLDVLEQYAQHGPAVLAECISRMVFFSVSLILLAVTAAWVAFTNWKWSAAVFEQGFAVRERKGLKQWRWEEVESITADTSRFEIGRWQLGGHVYSLLNERSERVVLTDAFVKVDAISLRLRS